LRLILAAVGRARPGPHLALQQFYAERLAWPLTILEVEEKRKLPAPERREREGALLLARLPERSLIIALDERGNAPSSADFAKMLGRWRDGGAETLAFLVGGADGHSEAVRQRAAALLAFGPMTWPHLLVRGMLLEQLYRAQQILAGHPYHRD
jgi:23S rRNA (pseudouridine1915-N3)-methyltransferase